MAPVNGMDTYSCPDANIMSWLRNNGNFRIICFYLRHTHQEPDASWSSGARSTLAANGWGFFPTYGALRAENPNLNSTSGANDGQDAVNKMRCTGFANGSVIYLDIETGGAPNDAYISYISAWVGKVRALNFIPAIYGPYTTIQWARGYAPALTDIFWSANPTPGTHGQACDPNNLPPASIDPGCIATQYRQGVTLDGLIIPPSVDTEGLDLNLSLVADPSNAAVVQHALSVA
jgi:hypothetical protein